MTRHSRAEIFSHKSSCPGSIAKALRIEAGTETWPLSVKVEAAFAMTRAYHVATSCRRGRFVMCD